LHEGPAIFNARIQTQLLQAIGIVRQTAAWFRSVALVLLGAMGDSDGECQAVRPDNIIIHCCAPTVLIGIEKRGCQLM